MKPYIWHFMILVLHQSNFSQNRAQYTQAQKQKKHFCRLYNEMVWPQPLLRTDVFISFDGFAWNHADGNDEAPVVKLMKSSTFSYEQAWHRLVALSTVHIM